MVILTSAWTLTGSVAFIQHSATVLRTYCVPGTMQGVSWWVTLRNKTLLRVAPTA